MADSTAWRTQTLDRAETRTTLNLHQTHTRRTLERYETRPTQGASDVLDLPYGTLNDEADMREYTEETANGIIPKRTISRVTGKEEEYELVTFTVDDPENPKNWSKGYKWYCTMVVALTCFVVALASSVVTADLDGPEEEFGASHEVALLSITLFVIGFGVGPLAFAPFSELFGRKPVYVVTMSLAVIFVIPCAWSRAQTVSKSTQSCSYRTYPFIHIQTVEDRSVSLAVLV